MLFKKFLKVAFSIIAVLAISLAFSVFAEAKTLSELRAEAKEVQSQIDEVQGKLDAASRQYDEAVARYEEAHSNAEKAKGEKEQIKADLAKVEERVSERVVYQYKNRSVSMIDLLLAAESFEDVEKAFTLVDKMNNEDQQLANEKLRLQWAWEEEEMMARASEEEAAAQKELAQGIKDEAQSRIDELQDIYDGLSDEVASILRSQQMATTYRYSQASPSGSGTDWSGVQAPADANDIVARAYSALGSPYSWGGVGNGGYDCSGLVSYCVSGEHTRIGTTGTFMGYERTSNPEPGDIVTNSGHCGIYIGDGKMIHSSDYGTGVIISDVQSGMIAVKP